MNVGGQDYVHGATSSSRPRLLDRRQLDLTWLGGEASCLPNKKDTTN